MADSVQYHVESMAAELEDFLKRKIFQEYEIQAIVKKTTSFEYKLKRRIAKKEDFLLYIEYQMNLEALRALRMKNGEKMKNKSVDTCILKKIYSLFERAVSKFAGDYNLWFQYIEFLKSKNNSIRLSNVMTRAIQLFPSKYGFWVLAAQWELEANGNVQAARVLLQRGLRINADNEKLWLEYFKFECLYVEKIRRRHEILFKEKAQMGNDKGASINLPLLKNEEAVESSNVEGNSDQATFSSEFFKGEIPKFVYQKATSAISSNPGFHLEFLKLTKLLNENFEMKISIENYILDNIKSKFQNDPAFRSVIAERHIEGISVNDPDFPEKLKKCFEEFNQASEEIVSADMMQQSILLLKKIESKCDDCHSAFTVSLRTSIFRRMHDTFVHARANNLMNEFLYVTWLRNLQVDDEVKPELTLEISNEAVRLYPLSGDLWIMRLSLALQKLRTCSKIQMEEKILEDLKVILTKGSNATNGAIYKVYFEFLVDMLHEHRLPPALLVCEFATVLKSREIACVQEIFKMFLMLDIAKDRYKEIITFTNDLNFVLIALEFERSMPQQDAKRITELYEISLEIDPSREDLWIEYILFERAQSDFNRADHLYWKAMKTIKNTESFNMKLTAANNSTD